MVVSGQIFSTLIAIVLMQACLLHAKSLRVATKVNDRPVITDSPVKRSAGDVDVSSCSPDQYLVEYFNELYSTNAANSFSGNALQHALRAMEADKNRSESAMTKAGKAAEPDDDAIIANITDQTRFTPAGLSIASKAICAKILQEMDAAASVIIETALCGWDYVCDYKPDRFPNYLFKARCKTARCKSNCSQKNNHHNRCQSHGITVNVLMMKGNCEEWVWGQELLPVACTCTPDAMMTSGP